MANLVETLPKEYRTPSLESLPKDLQAIAVRRIKAKFDLTIADSASTLAEPVDHIYSDAITTTPYTFKAGDIVINKGTAEIDVVESVPGMAAYDAMDFSSADEGFLLQNNSWDFQRYWVKYHA